MSLCRLESIPNSSPTGNDCRTIHQSLELLEDRLDAARRQSRPDPVSTTAAVSRQSPTGSRRFSGCFRQNAATVSNSAIPAGKMPLKNTQAAVRSKRLCSAYRIITTRQRRGSAPLTSSTSEGTAPADAIRGIIGRRCWPIGPNGSAPGKRQGCDVYVYFDNDQKSAAPADAIKLRQLLM